MTTDLDAIPPARLRIIILNIARLTGRTRMYRGYTLRYVVPQSFGVGLTTASALCLRADLSPNVTIPLKP